jgi:hypothetical protein
MLTKETVPGERTETYEGVMNILRAHYPYGIQEFLAEGSNMRQRSCSDDEAWQSWALLLDSSC